MVNDGKYKIGSGLFTVRAIEESTGQDVTLTFGAGEAYSIERLSLEDFSAQRKEVRIIKAVGGWPVGKEIIVPAGHADDLVSRGFAELTAVQPEL